MGTAEIDRRSKADVVEQIRNLALTYTPEWRFTEENPDLGSVLALLFADLFHGTVQRYNQVLEKHRVAFLNSLDLSLKPAVAARGIVCFSQSADFMSGVYVPSQTRLIADDDQEHQLIFQTERGVFVTGAQIQALFYQSPVHDTLLSLYDGEGPLEQQRLQLFDPHAGTNLQHRFLAFAHGTVLQTQGFGSIEIELKYGGNPTLEKQVLTFLSDLRRVRWVYYHQGEWKPFDQVRLENSVLKLEGKQVTIVPETYENHTSCWIGCQVLELAGLSSLPLGQVKLRTAGKNIPPQILYVEDREQVSGKIHPFGEELALYRECYLASDEVLTKTGARITLTFDLDYQEFEREMVMPYREVDWKLIMRRPPAEYRPEKTTVVCNQVVWEYWNSMGWARLPLEGENETLFDFRRRGTITLTFQCPENLAPILVHAYESHWIRFRLVGAAGIYSNHCIHQVPVMKNIKFDYTYALGGRLPEKSLVSHDLATEDISASVRQGELRGLFPSPELFNTLYLVFNRRPEGSPLHLYFHVLKGRAERRPPVEWEYYGGGGKWRRLKLTDRTQHLADPGIVTILVPEDMEEREQFNTRGFWIRVVDRQNGYHRADSFPQVEGIFLNAVEVCHEEHQEEAVFYIEERRAHFSLTLAHENLLQVTVKVNEAGVEWTKGEQTGSGAEPGQSKGFNGLAQPVELVKDETGRVTEVWVTWQEVTDFFNSGPDDRHYRVDRITGTLTFGDGKKGSIPPKREGEALRVTYTTGGGLAGNLSPGRIDRLADAIRFIGGVKNPLATYGGFDHEEVSAALGRGTQLLKHRDRAVTERDFEALAREASPNVVRAKCLSNITKAGVFQPGQVSLVLLLREHQGNPGLFLSQREVVSRYLEKRVSGTLLHQGMEIMEPLFVRLSTKLWISVPELENIYVLQRKLRQEISRFIDPFTGNFDGRGWEIGQLPSRDQLLSFIKSIDSDCSIERMIVTVSTGEQESFQETDLQDLKQNPFYLAVNGDHEITLFNGFSASGSGSRKK